MNVIFQIFVIKLSNAAASLPSDADTWTVGNETTPVPPYQNELFILFSFIIK